MTDRRRRPASVAPPDVPPPPPFDRRLRARRRADHDGQEEVAFLARCLDVLAAGGPAEERLAAVLDLLAETAGAQRAAVLADGGERRVAVVVRPGEPPTDAEALAAWLDAGAPRTRAERAASRPALVSLAIAGQPAPQLLGDHDAAGPASPIVVVDADVPAAESGEPVVHYACLTVPSSSPVVLGFAFRDSVAAEHCAERLPPSFIRHAGAAIALLAQRFATERELDLLRAQDEERTRFVSTVAHELRTPLTGLGGYLELILSDSVADPSIQREFLERSRDIVASIDELVGDLLELSRIESGSLRLEIGHFSLGEMGQRVVDHLAPIALERGIRLEANLPPRLRAATGDRRRVEQVVRNLVGNALKFTPADGHVELAAWFEGQVAVVAIRDDGHGIAPDDRARIWDRFYRMAAHARITGTGLGLPIARELARAMGGELDVASVPRVGSSFVLALPGTTPVSADDLADTLRRTIAAEEARLDERGMRRRLQALERVGDGPRDRPAAVHASAPAPADAAAPAEGRPIGRAVHLRAIDGGAGPMGSRPA
jgi:signal transduction histidine kinase